MKKLFLATIIFTLSGSFNSIKSEAKPLSLKMAVKGTKVFNAYWGVSFNTPPGWSAKETPNGYVLSNPNKNGFIVVMPHTFTRVQDLKNAISAGQGINDQTTSLFPDSEFQSYGKNGFSVYLGGTINNLPARARVIGLVSPYSTKGAVVLSVANQSDYTNEYDSLNSSVAQSISFVKPDTKTILASWNKVLKGKKMTFISSYYSGGGFNGGYISDSQKAEFNLCSNGSFTGSGSSSSAVDSGSNSMSTASGPQNFSGNWKVVFTAGESVLYLNDNNGKNLQAILSMDNKGFYLNGKRWYLTPSSACK